MKLTPNEFAVLRAIDDSEFGDGLMDAIWTFSIADNVYLNSYGDMPKSSIPGIVASLNKKGYLVSQKGERGERDSDGVYMTEAGADAYIEANGGKCNKPR